MAKKKLTHQQARMMLELAGINFKKDVNELRMSELNFVADAAKLAGYRKRKNAPGSTGRMYYQYLQTVEPGGISL